MRLTVPESKATASAALLLRGLLEEAGPQPLSRPWFPGERNYRAAEVEALVRKIRDATTAHARICNRGSRCRCPRHSLEVALDATELWTMIDGLDIAHILLTSGHVFNGLKDKDRYDMLKQVRAVLFKCGSIKLSGAKT